MLPAGRFVTRITFQRNVGTEDALGGDGPETWVTLFACLSSRADGSGAERRAAAGEQAVKKVSFRVRATRDARAVTVRDRILCDGLPFDIQDITPYGAPAPSEIEFTATASLG